MEKEFFIPVKIEKYDFTGLYEVSNKDRVISIRNDKFHKELRGYSDGRRGYLKIKLYDRNKKPHNLFIHRVVLESFCTYENKIIPPHCTVDHIDFDKLNNKLENLRWLSKSENSSRKDVKSTTKTTSNEKKLQILCLYFIEEKTMKRITKETNIDLQIVSDIVNGRKKYLGETSKHWCRKHGIKYVIRKNNDFNKFGNKKRIRV